MNNNYVITQFKILFILAFAVNYKVTEMKYWIDYPQDPAPLRNLNLKYKQFIQQFSKFFFVIYFYEQCFKCFIRSRSFLNTYILFRGFE